MIFVVLIYYFVYIDCSNTNSFDNHLLSNNSVLDIELYGKVTKVNMEKKTYLQEVLCAVEVLICTVLSLPRTQMLNYENDNDINRIK